jgi:hypothetical protein
MNANNYECLGSVRIAALPAPSDSGNSVTSLLSLLLTNYNLLTIRLYREKVVNSTQLYSGGLSRLLRSLTKTPLKI